MIILSIAVGALIAPIVSLILALAGVVRRISAFEIRVAALEARLNTAESNVVTLSSILIHHGFVDMSNVERVDDNDVISLELN